MSPVLIHLGTSNPNTLLPPCRLLTLGDLGYLSISATEPMGHGSVPYTIPNDANLLHHHIFVQAQASSGPTIRYSNAVRLTIGGIYP